VRLLVAREVVICDKIFTAITLELADLIVTQHVTGEAVLGGQDFVALLALEFTVGVVVVVVVVVVVIDFNFESFQVADCLTLFHDADFVGA
jgi:hypothetical protein